MLLDTTILIDALRSRPRVVDRLHRHGGPFFASVLSVDELLVGVRTSEEKRTDALIGGLELLAVGIRDVRIASAWRRSFRFRGVTLKQADCLIAAAAALNGLPLATANVKDFPMPELRVAHWPSE